MFTGWRKASGPRLWRIDLQPREANLPSMPHDVNMATLSAYSAYDLPRVAALIRYFRVAAGCRVWSTWLKAISTGNYSSWPGLTLINTTKYCPSATATIMGHLIKKRQGVRSTKPKPPTKSSPDDPIPRIRSNELFIQVTPISKLYTDDTGRFPIHACSVNQYIMIAYHCNANMILAEPFTSRKDKHCIFAYDKLMRRLCDNKLTVDLQILDNEASAEYKRSIKGKRNTNYQLVPPNTHRINAAERAICKFKAHFISILAGVVPDFPRNLWDLLLSQTELTLNLLRQATLDPSRSAWSYSHGPFNYDATPIRTLGCNIIAYQNTGTRHSWDFCGAADWNVGVALQHYRCHTIVVKATQASQISDTVEFRYHCLTQPTVTQMDRIVHGVTTLTCALHEDPSIACENQFAVIQALHQAIQRWAKLKFPTRTKQHLTTIPHRSTKQRSILCPM